jgi:hypothetical protein
METPPADSEPEKANSRWLVDVAAEGTLNKGSRSDAVITEIPRASHHRRNDYVRRKDFGQFISHYPFPREQDPLFHSESREGLIRNRIMTPPASVSAMDSEPGPIIAILKI